MSLILLRAYFYKSIVKTVLLKFLFICFNYLTAWKLKIFFDQFWIVNQLLFIMIIVAYMERTPYEVSFPSYGISYNTTDDASTWYSGFRVHRCPELPLHFTIAMTGCAMSILLTSYVETGGELDKCFLEHVGMIVTLFYFSLFSII